MSKFAKNTSHRFGAPPPQHLIRANFELIRQMEQHKQHARAPIYKQLADNPFCPRRHCPLVPCVEDNPCPAACVVVEAECHEPKDEHHEGEGVDWCALYQEPEETTGENPQNTATAAGSPACTNVSRFLKRQTTTRW